jgi:hypothetical protein
MVPRSRQARRAHILNGAADEVLPLILLLILASFCKNGLPPTIYDCAHHSSRLPVGLFLDRHIGAPPADLPFPTAHGRLHELLNGPLSINPAACCA